MKKHPLLPALILVLFAAGGITLITLTDMLTAEQRTAEKQAALQQLLQAVAIHQPIDDAPTAVYTPTGDVGGIRRVYPLTAMGDLIGYALEIVSTEAYNGEIHLLVGIDLDHRISGMHILHHRETPGLGDRIETAKSNWLTGFDGLSAAINKHQWILHRQNGNFDHLTGATVTAKAVLNATYRSLIYLREHPDFLHKVTD